jgi:hypothetical protein
MIYIAAYIVLGISTGVLMRVNGEAKIGVSIAGAFVWPLYWFAFVYAHFAGLMPAKCAWCGKLSVGPMRNMEAWRKHYLTECDKHPLYVQNQRLQNYLDETDAKCTHYRVKCEMLEAQMNAGEE